jgi:hypothetical protein
VVQDGSGERFRGKGVRVVDEGLSLVDFLADLRRDLVLARQQAVTDAVARVAAGGDALWLDVGQVTVTVQVEHSGKVSGEASGEVEGKFWVFGSAKAGAKVGGEASRTGTQTLTLTLKPRLESVIKDSEGRSVVQSMSLAVEGDLDPREQLPPPLPDHTGQ